MTPHDALDPGDGTYPHAPRLPDGSVDPVRFPTGLRRHKDPTTGAWITIDVTPTAPDGSEIVPPPIPPV